MNLFPRPGILQAQWDILCGFRDSKDHHETGNPLFVAAAVSVDAVREAVKALKASVLVQTHPREQNLKNAFYFLAQCKGERLDLNRNRTYRANVWSPNSIT